MAIDSAEVLRIARLARLELPEGSGRLLDDAALERLAGELDRILGHMEDLGAVPVEGVLPTAHGIPLPPRTREDVPEPTLEPSRVVEGAPDAEGEAFRVPRVLG